MFKKSPIALIMMLIALVAMSSVARADANDGELLVEATTHAGVVEMTISTPRDSVVGEPADVAVTVTNLGAESIVGSPENGLLARLKSLARSGNPGGVLDFSDAAGCLPGQLRGEWFCDFLPIGQELAPGQSRTISGTLTPAAGKTCAEELELGVSAQLLGMFTSLPIRVFSTATYRPSEEITFEQVGQKRPWWKAKRGNVWIKIHNAGPAVRCAVFSIDRSSGAARILDPRTTAGFNPALARQVEAYDNSSYLRYRLMGGLRANSTRIVQVPISLRGVECGEPTGFTLGVFGTADTAASSRASLTRTCKRGQSRVILKIT